MRYYHINHIERGDARFCLAPHRASFATWAEEVYGKALFDEMGVRAMIGDLIEEAAVRTEEIIQGPEKTAYRIEHELSPTGGEVKCLARKKGGGGIERILFRLTIAPIRVFYAYEKSHNSVLYTQIPPTAHIDVPWEANQQ